MDLTTIHSTIRTILKDRPEYLRYFENTFRECISAIDIQLLLKATITNHSLSTSFTTALEKTSSHIRASESNSSLADMLWNPLVASTIQLYAHSQISDHPPVQEKSVREKTNSKTKKSKASTVSNGQTERPPASNVYQELGTYLANNPAPYASTQHIRCDTAGCEFCIGMFKGIQLTQCVNHRRCVPSGWFPHVGKPLWSSLRKKHDPQRAFVNTPRSVKSDEMPNVASVTTSDVENTTVMHIESWADEDQDDVLSIVSNDTLAIPPASPEPANRVEEPRPSERRSTSANPLARYAVSDEQDDILYRQPAKWPKLGNSTSFTRRQDPY